MSRTKNQFSVVVVEAFGWVGLIAVLAAFSLASFGVVEARSYVFQLLTLFGSLSLGAISLLRRAYQPATLNMVLGVIALITIVSLVME